MKRTLPVKERKKRASELLEMLYEHYPNPFCALNFTNPFELLIATILSAQCTDERVNKVTAILFKTYSGPESLAEATLEEIEEVIRPTGFYRNKAKSIKESSQKILEEFEGEVPQTMDELLSLRGVARKTANVVLGNAYGKNEGVVVDTHVGRLARRFGLTTHSDPVKVEKDLMDLFPREEWTNVSHLFIAHGRAVCKSRFSTPPNHIICNVFGTECACKKII
ncbi:endonuclease III [Balneolaceae bacterium ANBcel3]|nr:endonuclease III [Balneolaceae bacterium ANBcel3]